MNNLWQDLNFVTVLINLDTGKLIDIVDSIYTKFWGIVQWKYLSCLNSNGYFESSI